MHFGNFATVQCFSVTKSLILSMLGVSVVVTVLTFTGSVVVTVLMFTGSVVTVDVGRECGGDCVNVYRECSNC